MPNGQPNSLLRSLRRVALLRSGAELADGELLEGYLSKRDEGCFEALLHRHGPMVLGVCRRILHNEADAQDAFQATFLVFLRKAATIIPRALVGNWLHGVAYKTALKAQAMNRQRRAKERVARANVRPATAQDALQDRLELLDEALSRLPVKYRSAIVLCDLEGKTIKEAANQLSCPPGTVASRLAGGRALLAKRLARYGLCLTAATVAEALARGAVRPGVPKALVTSLVQAAATVASGQEVAGVMSAKVVVLTERVLKAMLIAKLKTLTTVLLVLAVLGGAGVLCSYPRLRAEQENAQAAPTSVVVAADEKPKSDKDEKPKSDKELIQGTWIPVSGEKDGKEIPKENLKGILTFTEDKFTMQLRSGGVREGTYTIDPEKKPKELDLTWEGNQVDLAGTLTGIYELKGTRLKYVVMERGRPSDFDSTGAALVIYEKKK
jgi:RNA polymerase sigma-70 factor (ECF subfamily)